MIIFREQVILLLSNFSLRVAHVQSWKISNEELIRKFYESRSLDAFVYVLQSST